MGFEEVFVFVVVGCVAIFWQRSPQRLSHQTQKDQEQRILLWMLAVGLPSLAIAWIYLNQTSLPLIFVVTGFLLSAWIYRNCNSDRIVNDDPLKLTPTEEKQIKSCFSPSIYQLKGLEFSQQEIYCRGNLRSQNYKYAYDTINQNLQKIFGDRFLCYLQEKPIENFGKGFGESQNESINSTNYCFYLLPTQNAASPNRFGWMTRSFGIIITCMTILAVSANIHRFEEISLINLQRGIPYLLGLASIFIARAIAQYIVIKKNKLKFTPQFLLPFLLPCIGGFGILGSLSSHTHKNFHSVVETVNPATQRRIIFDQAAIPAIAGLAISIILLISGNWLFIPETHSIADSAIVNSTISPLQMLPNLNNFDFKNSILTSLVQSILQKFFSIDKFVIAPDIIPAFSPLTLAGWTGLALSALQLMPFSFLDGGNLAIAMFGYRQAVQIARITRIVLLAIALLAQPWLRIYSLLLFLLPIPSPLILNETTEIGRSRDLIGMGLIAIALLIILPAPKSLL